ncbi:KN motif and ankyrin repeat domain-containing protein 1 isoform X2 [Petromyzon marinus]|uniref:KN motif and ankyrin repeat domain-containing protein 1 isoform X2 n=1 Tax=Petromyzon marinus TaxID=7757 RepID=UPI003F71290D
MVGWRKRTALSLIHCWNEGGATVPTNENEEEEAEEQSGSYFVETPYGFQLDLDFLKYVDDIEKGNTIRKISIQKKGAKALRNASSASLRSWGTPGEAWTSSESLSSSTSEESRLSLRAGSLPKRAEAGDRAPESSPGCPRLASPVPARAAETATATTTTAATATATTTGMPDPPALSPRSLSGRDLRVEKTLIETKLRLEREQRIIRSQEEQTVTFCSHVTTTVAAPARQRQHEDHQQAAKVSGGSDSRPEPSDFTKHEQEEPQPEQLYTDRSTGSVSSESSATEVRSRSEASSLANGLSAHGDGSASLSPSGTSTPSLSGLNQAHLQTIREQMVLALRRMRVLEDQVKVIPSLRDEIERLRAERGRLLRGAGERAGDRGEPGGASRGRYETLENLAERRQECTVNFVTSTQYNAAQFAADARGVAEPTRELQADYSSEGEFPDPRCDGDEACGEASARSSRANGSPQLLTSPHSAWGARSKVLVRSVGVGVTEGQLPGGAAPSAWELESQQEAVRGLREKVLVLEKQLRETTHELDMTRIKLELSGGPGKSVAERNVRVLAAQTAGEAAGPRTEPARAEAAPSRQSVSCQTEHVEGGGDGAEPSAAAAAAAEAAAESERALRIERRSVACGECSVDVLAVPPGERASRGTMTDAVGKADAVTMASPSTESRGAGNDHPERSDRCVGTTAPCLAEASTSAAVSCRDAQNGTVAVEVRTVSVGNCERYEDTRRSVGVNTAGVGAAIRPSCREAAVGSVDFSENFLVGAEVRSVSCDTEELENEAEGNEGSEVAGGAELSRYIEHVQRLLHEQQALLADNYAELADAFAEPATELGSLSSRLLTTVTALSSLQRPAATPPATQAPTQAPTRPVAPDAAEGGKPDPGDVTHRGPSESASDDVFETEGPAAQPAAEEEAEQRSRGHVNAHFLSPVQVASVSDAGSSSVSPTLKSIMKKKDGAGSTGGDPSSGTKKSLQFVGVNGGYETTSSEESSSESSSSGSEDEDDDDDEEEEEEEEEDDDEGLGEVIHMQPNGGAAGRSEAERQDGDAQEVGREEPVAEAKQEEQEAPTERYEMSESMHTACSTLKAHLEDHKSLNTKDVVRASMSELQHEWFRVSSQKGSAAPLVGGLLAELRRLSPPVLRLVANMADGNGNTALHYSVSHSNFAIVQMLLGTGECNVDAQNKAGYTAIMLASLAAINSERDMAVVQKLLSLGDVNARASQAGQTALMLAVSHGRKDMVRALLACGADVNVQDDDGSTALMCASEHGHVDIVRLLLAQAGCNAAIADNDGSTALSIALEAGHNDIAVLLYAHVNYAKPPSPGTPVLGRKMPQSPTHRIKAE